MLTHRLAKSLMRLQWIVTRVHVLPRRCRRWRQLPFDVRQRSRCLWWHIGEREPLPVVQLAQDFVLAQIESIAHAKPVIKTTDSTGVASFTTFPFCTVARLAESPGREYPRDTFPITCYVPEPPTNARCQVNSCGCLVSMKGSGLAINFPRHIRSTYIRINKFVFAIRHFINKFVSRAIDPDTTKRTCQTVNYFCRTQTLQKSHHPVARR